MKYGVTIDNLSDEQFVSEMTELGKILEKMGPDDIAKLLASDPSAAATGDAPSAGKNTIVDHACVRLIHQHLLRMIQMKSRN